MRIIIIIIIIIIISIIIIINIIIIIIIITVDQRKFIFCLRVEPPLTCRHLQSSSRKC